MKLFEDIYNSSLKERTYRGGEWEKWALMWVERTYGDNPDYTPQEIHMAQDAAVGAVLAAMKALSVDVK